MARRPAYNSKAERARRADVRSALFAELLDAGERAEILVPVMSAWVQSLRQEGMYTAVTGRPLARYASPEATFEEQVRATRDYIEIAWSHAYCSRAAHALGDHLADLSSSALRSASGNVLQVCPYTETELAAIETVSS